MLKTIKNNIKYMINPEYERKEWIIKKLKAIPKGETVLDAGCGSQQYRKYCKHLVYKAQDFGQVTKDVKESHTGSDKDYEYGTLDYTSNIWEIPVADESIDNILCAEVFEHIPYPNETIKEFQRLIKRGGRLILTFPTYSTRHMDPFYFYPGFTDNYIREIIEPIFEIDELYIQGNFYRILFSEYFRSMMICNNLFMKMFYFNPTMLYLYLKAKQDNEIDKNTSNCGLFIIATKR